MRSNRILAALAAGCLTLTSAALRADDLATQSFSAGSATCEDRVPQVAASPGGSFLLVWIRQCESPAGPHLAARPYDADARPIGPEVDLGPTAVYEYSLVALPNGTYALAWAQWVDRRAEIFLQKLDARGLPIANPFAVNLGD